MRAKYTHETLGEDAVQSLELSGFIPRKERSVLPAFTQLKPAVVRECLIVCSLADIMRFMVPMMFLTTMQAMAVFVCIPAMPDG